MASKGSKGSKMQPGECRCTRKGMKYCKTAKGVRFTGKC
ncbi:hypothetical protein ES705_10667 [subsurface metagenome]